VAEGARLVLAADRERVFLDPAEIGVVLAVGVGGRIEAPEGHVTQAKLARQKLPKTSAGWQRSDDILDAAIKSIKDKKKN